MKKNQYRLREGRLPLWSIFLIGLLTGIFTVNFGKSILLENTGLLDEYTLYHMKNMTVDSSALFCFVCGKRLKEFLIIVTLSTTYLGLVVCAGAAGWYGFAGGVFLATAVIRYGLKGVLLVFFSVCPQYIIYIPVLAALLLWCEKLNRSIYFKSGFKNGTEKELQLPGRVLQLLVILGFYFIGCILEGFVNPPIIQWFLGIF